MFLKKPNFIAGAIVVAASLFSVNAGWENITIGTADQVLTPGCYHTGSTFQNQYDQQWDVEALYFNGTNLTLTGGFDFKNGVYSSGWGQKFNSGDIFIDVNNDRRASTDNVSQGYNNIYGNLGYEYVVRLNSTTQGMTYDVINLTTGSPVVLSSTYFGAPNWPANDVGNPYEYLSGGTLMSSNLNANYVAGTATALAGAALLGGTHNSLTVDLSFLGNNASFYAHFSEGCGNDHVDGSSRVNVPEPGSLSLLIMGLGFIGSLSFFRLRRKNSSK